MFLAAAVLGCATSNQLVGFTGGFEAYPVGEDGFAVIFSGNSRTTPETIQAYWLYNCAVLVLSRGYDGFEVASSSVNVTTADADSRVSPPFGVVGAYLANQIAFTILPNAALQDNVRMLKKPFTANPPKVFDAAALKAALEPYVNGKKYGGNICPHSHDYLNSSPNG